MTRTFLAVLVLGQLAAVTTVHAGMPHGGGYGSNTTTLTGTMSASSTLRLTATASSVLTATASAVSTATGSLTLSLTTTITPPPTPTLTATVSSSLTTTITPPPTPTLTFTASDLLTASASIQPTATATFTATNTLAQSHTWTGGTPSDTTSFHGSFTPDLTPTLSLSISHSKSLTMTATLSASQSVSSSVSQSVTTSLSSTSTPSLTASSSHTASASLSTSSTPSVSSSPSPTTSPSHSASATLSQSHSATSSASQSQTWTESESASRQIMTRIDRAGFWLFSDYAQKSFASKRFMIVSSGGAAAGQVATALSWLSVRGRDDAVVQLYHTTNQFDYVDVGGQRCTSHMGLDGHESSVDPKTVACRSLQTCWLWPRKGVPTAHEFRIEAGPRFQSPTCNKDVYFFGQASIEGEFVPGPTYWHAVLGNTTNMTTDASGARLVPAQLSHLHRRGFSAINLLSYSVASAAADSNGTAARVPSVVEPLNLFEAAPHPDNYPTTPLSLDSATPLVTCQLRDISAFDPIPGVGTGDLAPCILAIEGGGSRPCTTTEDYHFACLSSIDCVGYSSRLVSPSGQPRTNSTNGDFVEEPFLLHTRFPSVRRLQDIPALSEYGVGVASVMFYRKPTEAQRTCVFPVAESGNVQVAFKQSSFSHSYAQVFLRLASGERTLLNECGRLRAFAATSATLNDVFGLSGVCDRFLPCHVEADVAPGSTIEVVAAATLSQDICTESLHVIANFTATTATATNASNATVYTPVNISGFERRDLYIPSTARPVIQLNAFVFGVSRAALRVTQTAYACIPGRDCSSPVINISLIDVTAATQGGAQPTLAAACGGSASFPNGAGKSGQCELTYDCGAGYIPWNGIMLPAPTQAPSSTGSANTTTSAGSTTTVAMTTTAAPTFTTLNATLAPATTAAPTTSTTFTGVVSLTVNTAFLRSSPAVFSLTSFCSEFNAVFWAERKATQPGSFAVPTFPFGLSFDSSPPLWSVSPQSFMASARRLGLANSSTTAAQVAANIGSAELMNILLPLQLNETAAAVINTTAEAHAIHLFRFGPFSAPLEGFYVSTSAQLPQNLSLYESMQSNVTLACVADLVTASIHRCVVPIPRASNYFRIRVAQTDFAENAIKMRLLDSRGVPDVDRTVSCGAAQGFLGAAGARADCDVYLDCVSSFLYPPGVANDSYAFVELSVPNTLTAQGCAFALSAFVDFSFRTFDAASNCTGFFCQADRKCLAPEQVCDGVQGDCTDRADETLCNNWQLVEVNHTIHTRRVLASAQNVAGSVACRRFAVMNTADGYVYDAINRSCEVYAPGSMNVLNANPSKFLTPQNGTEVYARLDSKLFFLRCTKTLHCSNNGELANAATLRDGDRCVCNCNPAYTGSDCSTKRTVGATATFHAVVPRTTEPVVLAALEDALSAGNKAIAVSLTSGFLPYNATHHSAPYSFSSFDVNAINTYRAAIFRPSTLVSINARLKQFKQPELALIFGSDGLNTFSQVGTCAVPSANSVATTACALQSAASGTNVSVGNLRVEAFGLQGFTVTVRGSPRGRRQATPTVINCTASSPNIAATRVNLLQPCYPTNCIVPSQSTVESVEVNVDSASTTTATTCAATPSVVVHGSGTPALPKGNTTAAVQVDKKQNQDFLNGAVGSLSYVFVAFVIGVICAVVAVKVFKRSKSTLKEESEAKNVGSSWFTDAVGKEAATIKLPIDTAVVAIAVFVSLVLVLAVAGFLLVMFSTSTVHTSNFALVSQFFQSSVCTGSDVIATLPFKAARLPSTGQCHSFAFVGQSDGALFGSATCVAGAVPGSYTVELVLTTTEAACKSGTAVSFPTNQCLDLATIVPSATGYVTLQCMEDTVAADLLTRIAALDAVIPQSQPLPVATIPSTFASFESIDPATGEVVYQYPFSARGTRLVSTSHDPDVLASMFSSDYFIDLFFANRIMLQTNETFGTYTAFTSNIELAYRTQLNTLPLTVLSNYTPHTPDYPVGFVFGGFQTVNEVSGSNTAPGAQRYFNMGNSPFDIGAHYNAATSRDKEGFTIRFWLRASTTTDGFAFVLSDVFEDTQSKASHIVEKLLLIARDGPSTSRSWYNESFHVYGSFFVNGPGRKFHYIMADPASSGFGADTMVHLTWDLEFLGLTHALNGMWHQISLMFRNENDRSFIVLGVDGESSLSKVGWRKCLPRRPTPIQRLGQATVESGTSSVRTIVAEGGAMYVGYFNGGVQHLKFVPSFESKDFAVRSGSREIRVKNAIRVHTVRAIFFAMMVCVAICLVAIVRHLRVLWNEAEQLNADEMEHLKRRYNRHKDRMYGPKWEPLSFESYKEVVQFSDAIFAMFIDECILSPLEDPDDIDSIRIVRVAWTALHPEWIKAKDMAKIKQMPTEEEWLDVLEEYKPDVELQRMQSSVFRPPTQKPNMAGARVGGNGANPALLTAIATLQASGIYVSTWTTPQQYKDTVGPIFKVFTLDFFGANPLTSPLVQLILVLVVLSVLAFVLFKDDETFFSVAARYQSRRDKIMRLKHYASGRFELLRAIDPELFLTSKCTYTYDEHVLDPMPRVAVHNLLVENKTGQGEVALDGGRAGVPCFVQKGSDQTVSVRAAEGVDWPPPRTDAKTEEGKAGESELLDADGNPIKPFPRNDEERELQKELHKLRLNVVEHRCREHGSYLIPLTQTDVTPFNNRRRCVVVENGRRCNRQDTKIWICVRSSESTCGERCCSYAVCEDHMTSKWWKKMPLAVAGILWHRLKNGPGWVVKYAFVALAIALYTPVMRTCLMILACHPLYQCVFPQCWAQVDQSFASAVYLSLVVVVFYGVGFPVVMTTLLARRVLVLSDVFKSASYGGAFLAREEDEAVDGDQQKMRIMRSRAWVITRGLIHLLRPKKEEPNHALVNQNPLGTSTQTARESSASNPLNPVIDVPAIAVDEQSPHASPRNATTPTGADGATPRSAQGGGGLLEIVPSAGIDFGTDQRNTHSSSQFRRRAPSVNVELPTFHTTDAVNVEEWGRFLLADQSALTPLYETVTFERIALVPLLHCSKFILLIPPLLLEPNSTEQLVFIAIGEAIYAVFLTSAAPFITRWMSVVVNISNLHQFLIVAYQAWYVSKINDEDNSGLLGQAMVGTSLTYICAIGLVIFIMLSSTIIAKMYNKVLGNRLFKKFVLPRIRNMALYVYPGGGTVRTDITGRAQVEDDDDPHACDSVQDFLEERNDDAEDDFKPVDGTGSFAAFAAGDGVMSDTESKKSEQQHAGERDREAAQPPSSDSPSSDDRPPTEAADPGPQRAPTPQPPAPLTPAQRLAEMHKRLREADNEARRLQSSGGSARRSGPRHTSLPPALAHAMGSRRRMLSRSPNRPPPPPARSANTDADPSSQGNNAQPQS